MIAVFFIVLQFLIKIKKEFYIFYTKNFYTKN